MNDIIAKISTLLSTFSLKIVKKMSVFEFSSIPTVSAVFEIAFIITCQTVKRTDRPTDQPTDKVTQICWEATN